MHAVAGCRSLLAIRVAALSLLFLPIAGRVGRAAVEPDAGFASGAGFNSPVDVAVADGTGAILCGGRFDSYQGQPSAYLARLWPDGRLDPAFAAQPRPDGRVRFLVPLADGRILIGGDFTKIGDVVRERLAWLLPDGAVDPAAGANVGYVGYGLDGLLVQADGGVLLTGSFSQVAGQGRSWIARLLPGGGLDTAYNPGVNLFFGAGSPFLLPDGRVVLDASWTGTGLGPQRSLICRLHPDGRLDTAFDTDSPVGFVESMARMPDGSIAVANSTGSIGRLFEDGPVDPDWAARVPGGFRRKFFPALRDGRLPCAIDGNRQTNGVVHTLRLLAADGSPDLAYVGDFDEAVESVVELPDGRLLVAGGFTKVAAESRGRVAVLPVPGGGEEPGVRWNGAIFAVEERTGRARLPLRRAGPVHSRVTVRVATGGGEARAGADYEASEKQVIFEAGQFAQVVDLGLVDDLEPEGEETFTVIVFGEGVVGSFGVAQVVIHSDEGLVSFDRRERVVCEAEPTVSVALQREGGVPYRAEVRALPGGGTAGASDMAFHPLVYRFAQGSRAAEAGIGLHDDAEVESEERAYWRLNDLPASYQAVPPSTFTLTLQDNDLPGAPGEALAGTARLLPTPEGALVVAGIFPTIHGHGRSNLARLFADGRVDPTFRPSPAPAGLPLGALPDGRFYLSYTPTNVINTGQTTNFLVRLRLDGSVDPTFVPTNRWKVSSVQRGTVLADGSVVMETYTTDSSGLVQDLMKFDADGRRVGRFASNAFSFGFSGTRYLVLGRHGDGLLVGGTAFVPGLPPNPPWIPRRRDLFRLTAAGEADLGFHCQVSGPPAAGGRLIGDFVVSGDGAVFIRGSFTAVDGQSRPGLARLRTDGHVDETFVPPYGLGSSQGTPMAVQPDGRLCVVMTAQSRLMRLTASGSEDRAFGPVGFAGGAIQDMVAMPDGRLVVSGTFRSVLGQPRWRLAWLDRDGGLLPDQPLRLGGELDRGSGEVGVWVESRVAGMVTVERAGPEWDWSSLGRFEVPVGATAVYAEPRQPGAVFFRARRAE